MMLSQTSAKSVTGRLVGFDIRLPLSEYLDHWWDEDQREQYLLRPEIEWPLSVDGLVWPSLFRFGQSAIPQLSAIRDRTIDWLGFDDPGELGENLDVLRVRAGSRSGTAIAIELFTDQVPEGNYITYFDKEAGRCGLEVLTTRPSSIPRDSEFLGFDIADGAHISGLSNCGYTEVERAPLREHWAWRLNDYGLLHSLPDAMEFRDMTDSRVSEHAPFWIFGISRLGI
jgi:hypothetical protein